MQPVKESTSEARTELKCAICGLGMYATESGDSIVVGGLSETGPAAQAGLRAGDKILIGKYAGADVKLVGKDQIIVREDDILGVLEEGIQ